MDGSTEFVPSPNKSPSFLRPKADGEADTLFNDFSFCEGDKPDIVINKDASEGEPTKYEGSSHSPKASLPAPCKWAQSLRCLLDDVKGVDLFRQFLKQEGHDTRILSFYFACRGFKKEDPADKRKLHKLMNSIYNKIVVKIKSISPKTKENIKLKIISNPEIDIHIFDVAHKEVEQYMLDIIYPRFMNSDFYLEYLRSVQNKQTLRQRECRGKPEPLEFPTIHEDSELSINKEPSVKESLLAESQVKTFQMNCQTNQTQKVYLNKDDGLKDSVINFFIRTISPVPKYDPNLARDNPVQFHALLLDKLQRVEERNTGYKFIEKYLATEDHRHQLFHLFQLQPAEDNAQDILDAHVSRVFKDTGLTPTLSPICNSPPVMKITGEDPLRGPLPGQNDHIQDMMNSYSQRVGQPSPFAVPYEMRYNRRDMNPLSNGSGALTYWTSEDNLPSRSSEHQQRSQDKRNKGYVINKFKEKIQIDDNHHVNGGIHVARKLIPDQNSCYPKSNEQTENSLLPILMNKTSLLGNSSDKTVVAYRYGVDSIPFKTIFPGKNITLKQFKTFLSKKEKFKYFFKRVYNDFGTGGVFEEVFNDSEILPLWEGKVFCSIQSMDFNTSNED